MSSCTGTLEGEEAHQSSLVTICFIVLGAGFLLVGVACWVDLHRYQAHGRLAEMFTENGISVNTKLFSVAAVEPWAATATSEQLGLFKRVADGLAGMHSCKVTAGTARRARRLEDRLLLIVKNEPRLLV